MKQNQFERIHGSKIQIGRRGAAGTVGIWPAGLSRTISARGIFEKGNYPGIGDLAPPPSVASRSNEQQRLSGSIVCSDVLVCILAVRRLSPDKSYGSIPYACAPSPSPSHSASIRFIAFFNSIHVHCEAVFSHLLFIC